MAVHLLRLDDHAIRQIRAGRQSVIVHPVNLGVFPHMPTPDVKVESASGIVQYIPGGTGHQSPFGVVGDGLPVRESWALDLDCWPPPTVEDARTFLYRADASPDTISRHKWENPDDLPARAFRLFLQVEDLRIGRLHKVAADRVLIQASGIPMDWEEWDGWPPPHMTEEDFAVSSPDTVMEYVWRKRFRDGDVWAWDNNPLVWVMRFSVLSNAPEGFPVA